MNILKKSLLISSSLLGIVHGALAMNDSLEEDNTHGNGSILRILPSSPKEEMESKNPPVDQDIVVEMRNKIRTITQRVQKSLEQGPDVQPGVKSVIILGPAGSGKSTLVNLLAGIQLIAKKSNSGFRVYANEPLPGFEIQHKNIPGTLIPSSWYDAKSETLFWDCPGFGDPRGALEDVINAFAIHKLFKPHTKILLIAPEAYLDGKATHFLELFNKLAGIFPQNQQLTDNLSVVVSKQHQTSDILAYLRKKILPLSQKQHEQLTPQVRTLLQFLVDHPGRIASFPLPTTPGQYAPNIEQIRQAIYSSNYMPNPIPRITIDPKAGNYVNTLGRILNDSIVDYIRSEGDTSISNYCDQLIDSYVGPVGQLRPIFKNLKKKLKELRNTVTAQNPTLFPQGLKNLFGDHFDVNDINNTIEHIQFFKGFHNEITCHIADWTNALLPTINRIKPLTNNPVHEFVNNRLRLKGIIIGTSDVVQALQKPEWKNTNSVDVSGLSRLFIDEDIRSPGMNLMLKAPVWRVIGTRVIDISGKTGEAEGSNGGDGGNFKGWGDTIFDRKNLTIRLNGGNGANGKDGSDAEISYVKNRVRNGENNALIFRQKYTNKSLTDFCVNWGLKFLFTVNNQYIEIYETSGTPGTLGGKAGRGGIGQIGGLNKKSNLIENFKGKNGLSGKDGKDGKTYSGIYFAEYVLGGLRVNEKDEYGERARQSRIEIGKQAAKQAATEIGKQAAKQSVIETGKQATKQAATEIGKQAAKRTMIEASKQGGIQFTWEFGKQTAKQSVIETGKQATKQAVTETGKQAAKRTMIEASKQGGMQFTWEFGKQTAKQTVIEAGKQTVIETGKQLSVQVIKAVGPSLLFTGVVSPASSWLSSGWREGPNHISRLEDLTDEIEVRQELEKWTKYMNIYESFLFEKRKILIKQIQKEMPHISQSFITTILANHFNEPNEAKKFNLTGSPLSKQILKNFITYMDLSTYVYTNKSTKSSPGRAYPYSVQKNWRKIIGHQKEITRLYNNLLTISGKEDKILGKNLVYEQKGTKTIPSREILAISIDALIPELEKRYGHWLKKVNHFLRTINKTPITYKKLSESSSAKKELVDVFSAINDEYSWYFGANSPSSASQFKYAEEDVYQPTNKAVVAASFLNKTGLLQNSNITVLDVGFRNSEKLSGFMSGARRKAVGLAMRANFINPYTDPVFPGLGEVDYIAYIEKDTNLEKKDKLIIVYTGSNSPEDWIINFTLGWTRVLNLSVHEGIGNLFNDSQENYLPSLIDSVKRYYFTHQKPKNFEIITLGHSLGGGLAPLAAYYFKTKQQKVFKNILNLDSKDKISVKTFTFGAPAIVDKASKDIMERELGKDNIFRVWSFEDSVVNKTDNAFFQRSVHVGRSFPLYNIENLSSNLFTDIRGEAHSLGHYRCYLQALDQENSSLNHQKLTSILTEYISELYVPKGIAHLRELQREIGKKRIHNVQDQNSDLGDKNPVDEEYFFSFKEIDSRESDIIFPAAELEEYNFGLPINIKHESLELAEEQGEVGPESIPGWELHNPPGDGNCFYHALVHQMQRVQHPFLDEVDATTEPHTLLRNRIQREFIDGEWAGDDEMDQFVRQFDVVLAVIDTRYPENGYVYRFIGGDNEVVYITGHECPNLGIPVLRIAGTGDHFLSVVREAS